MRVYHCVRCGLGEPGDPLTILANTDISVCRECERAWVLSPESRRLRAISSSLFNEFVERERCEKLVEEEAQRLAAADGAGDVEP